MPSLWPDCLDSQVDQEPTFMWDFYTQALSHTTTQCNSSHTCDKQQIQVYTRAFFFFFFFVISGPHPRHMEVPRQSELQLLAYATATATPDPSHICNLHHSSRQCQILNPLSEARDGTHACMDTSWVPKPLSHHGNSKTRAFWHQIWCSFQRRDKVIGP